MIPFRYWILLLAVLPPWSASLSGQLTIPEIQGQGNVSPFFGSTVDLDTCMVTVVGQGSFFVSSLQDKADQDPLTSESLWILFGNSRSLQPGDLITATGRVTEDGSFNTVLIAETILKVGSVGIPDPIRIDTLKILENRNVYTYESLEGSWVSVSGGFLVNPKEKGEAMVINPLGERSFRETGILFPSSIPGIPQFDGNPELLTVEPGRFIQPQDTALAAGSRITTIGILVQRPDGYAIWPTSLLIGPTKEHPAPPKDDDRILSVASMNIRQFGRDDPDYQIRLDKISTYIRDVAGIPDIIALQEIQSAPALQDLIQRIGPISGGYRYQYFIDQGNGNSSIHSAFLYKPCFDSISFQRLGVFESLSTGGILHDRPPVMMSFDFPGEPGKRVHILNLHLRSLNGIEGSNSAFVRRKRYEQSQSVARMISRIDPSEPLIVLGDFNAYPYSDGYVDVFNQISGKKSQGAIFPVIPILTDSLDAPLLRLEEDERYSYIFQSNSQLLDHIITRSADLFEDQEYWMLRGNADSPETWLRDPQKKWRFSDHDVILAHFELALETECKEPEIPVEAFEIYSRNPQLEGEVSLTAEIPFEGALHLEIFTINGSRLYLNTLQLARGRHELDLHTDIVQGIYLLRARFNDMTRTLKWVVY